MHRVSTCPSAGLARTLSKACALVIKLHCLPMPTESSIWTSKAFLLGESKPLPVFATVLYTRLHSFFPETEAEDIQQQRRPERWRNAPGISHPPTGGFCLLALTSFSLGGSHQASCLLLWPTSGKWEVTRWVLQNVAHLPGVQIVVGPVTLTALFSRLWRVWSEGDAWVFSKGEVIPVTNNNICSYSGLDKGN